jgi:hypothetical protein
MQGSGSMVMNPQMTGMSMRSSFSAGNVPMGPGTNGAGMRTTGSSTFPYSTGQVQKQQGGGQVYQQGAFDAQQMQMQQQQQQQQFGQNKNPFATKPPALPTLNEMQSDFFGAPQNIQQQQQQGYANQGQGYQNYGNQMRF